MYKPIQTYYKHFRVQNRRVLTIRPQATSNPTHALNNIQILLACLEKTLYDKTQSFKLNATLAARVHMVINTLLCWA